MKKLLLGIVLFLPSAVFGGQLQSKRFFQNNGGLIDHISPLLIPETHASSLQNITMDDRGQLSKRNGYTVIQSTSTFGSTSAVTGGGFHKASSGSDFFSVIVGTSVFRIGSTLSSYSNVTGTVTLTAASSNLAQVTHLQDKTVFCNETDGPFYVGSTGNATPLPVSLFTAAKTCSTYGSYLVLANTIESSVAFPSRVRWSDINNVTSFPTLNYIDIEPDDGDRIVGMVAFDESVYIFKKKSIYRMLITGLDGPDAFIIRPVSRNIGAWSKQSIKVIPNAGIGFVAQNTAYILNGSNLTPIGDAIQRTFDGLSRPMWSNIVGEVYPKKYQYWLAVSTNGTTNTEVLVYDYIQKNWTVFDDIKANMLAQSEDSNGQNLLISGDYSGVTYKHDTGTSDNPGNVASAIVGSYTTGDLTFDSPEITKGFKYLYIFSQVDSTTTVTVEGAFDYQSSFEYSQSADLGQAGALYDTAIYNMDTFPAAQYKVIRLEINRSARAMKLRFSNSSASAMLGIIGWVPVYSLEDWRS